MRPSMTNACVEKINYCQTLICHFYANEKKKPTYFILNTYDVDRFNQNNKQYLNNNNT